MQALAQNGNGQAAYIDTLSEARKVLVDQLTGALFPIANDVKIQVEWNPATVAEYQKSVAERASGIGRHDHTGLERGGTFHWILQLLQRQGRRALALGLQAVAQI